MTFKRSAVAIALSIISAQAIAQTAGGGLFTPEKDESGKPTGESTYSPSVNTSLPELASDGIRLLGLRVVARPTLRMGYDDNITNLPNTAAAPARKATTTNFDIPITVALGRGLSMLTEGTEYRVTANLALAKFNGNSIESQNNSLLGLDAYTRYSQRLDSRLGVAYETRFDPRGSIENTGLEPNRSNITTVRAGGGFGAPTAQGRIEFDASFSDQAYQNNRQTTTFLDRQTSSLAGRFLYRVAPKTRAVFELQRTTVDFQNDMADTATGGTNTTGVNRFFASQDQTDTRASVGLRWEATAITTGNIRVGRARKQFDIVTPERPNATAGFYDASVTWAPLSYSTVNFSAGQNFNDSFRTSAAQVARRKAVTWNHVWAQRFSTNVSVSRITDSFDNFILTTDSTTHLVNRRDKLDVLSVAANYAFTPTIRIGAELRQANRRSNIAPGFLLPNGSINGGTTVSDNFTYDKNVALLTVSAVF